MVAFGKVKLNGFATKLIQRVAVGEFAGQVAMTIDQRSSNHVTYDKSEPSTYNVEIVNLDQHIEQNDLPLPHVIKIDIEGMEPKALRGAKETLLKARPIVICEINHCFDRYQKNLLEFVGEMERLGYALHKMDDSRVLHKILKVPVAVSDLERSIEQNYWFIPA